METSQQEKLLRAKEKVRLIKKFYTSLIVYIVFMIFLGWLNYNQNEWENPWIVWVAFGWGIALIFKGLKAFDLVPFLGRNWEERKIKEFIEEERKTKWK